MFKKIILATVFLFSTAYANDLHFQCMRSSDGVNTHYRCRLLEQNKILVESTDKAEQLYKVFAKHAPEDCGAGTCRIDFVLKANNS